MSEYWKSTPKYWCKHCKTFVRDSKLEKQNHEATPRHQGNLQRFLRELHRNNEREAREKQRGKDEVARLKGIASGVIGSASAPSERKAAISTSGSNGQATAADRKRQLQQLAEMGIAVPEEARREMAIAGDWHVQSVRPIFERPYAAQGEGEDVEEGRSAALAVGVHKRKFEDDEEREQAGERVVKRGWGSTTRTWQSDDKDDLDALLSVTRPIKQNKDEHSDSPPLETSPNKVSPGNPSHAEQDEDSNVSAVKREEDDTTLRPTEKSAISVPVKDTAVKSEVDIEEPSILFKKRKSKQIRQKE